MSQSAEAFLDEPQNATAFLDAKPIVQLDSYLAALGAGANIGTGEALTGVAAWLTPRPSPTALMERAMGRAAQSADQTPGRLLTGQGPASDLAEQRPGEGATPTIPEISSTPLGRVGSFITQTGRELEPKSPGTISKVAEAVGGFLPVVASGPAAPAMIGAQATGSSLNSQFDKFKEQGMSDEAATQAALVSAKRTGMTQAAVWEVLPAPIKKLVTKFTGKIGGGAVAQFLARRLAGATEGAVLGGSSQAAANVTTGQPITQNLGSSTAAMGAIGAITSQAELKEQQDAQRIRGNQGQPASPGQVPQGVKTDSGNDVQQAAPGPPQPVVQGEAQPPVPQEVKPPVSRAVEIADWPKDKPFPRGFTNDALKYGANITTEDQLNELIELEAQTKADFRTIPKDAEHFNEITLIGSKKQWLTEAIQAATGKIDSGDVARKLLGPDYKAPFPDEGPSISKAELPAHLEPFADYFEDPSVFGPAKLAKEGLAREQVIQQLDEQAKIRNPDQVGAMAKAIAKARTVDGAIAAIRKDVPINNELLQKRLMEQGYVRPKEEPPKPKVAAPEPDMTGVPTDEEQAAQLREGLGAKGFDKRAGRGNREGGAVQIQPGETVVRTIDGKPVTGEVYQHGATLAVKFKMNGRDATENYSPEWVRGQGADRPIQNVPYAKDQFTKDFLKATNIKQAERVRALPTVLEKNYPGLMERVRIVAEQERNNMFRAGEDPNTFRQKLGFHGKYGSLMTALADAAKAQDELNRQQESGRYYASASQAKVNTAVARLQKILGEIMGEKSPVPDLAAEGLKGAVARENKEATPKPGPEAGFGLVPSPPKILENFVKRNVVPLLRNIKDTATATRDLIVNAVSPASSTKPNDVDILFASKGWKEKFMTQAAASMDHMRQEMDKLDHAQQIAFVDRIKRGQAQPNPDMEDLAKLLRRWDDQLYNEAKKFSPGLNYLDNHYRVLWKELPGAEELLNAKGQAGTSKEILQSKRPWRGNRGFLLKHTLEDMSEGIAKGGVPVSYNPVDMFLLHAQDVTKFIAANRAWGALKDSGSAEFVKIGSSPPPGFTKLDDAIARPYFKTDEGLLAKSGEWWVDSGVGRMLNNYLSRDWLRQGPAGAVGRALLDLKNATTAIELSVSPFHAVFETNEAVGSALGLAIAKMTQGKYREGAGEFLRTLPGTIPVVGGFVPKTGNMEALTLGRKMIEFAKAPEDFKAQYPEAFADLKKKYPDFEGMVNDLFAGGGQVAMHENYHIQAAKGLREAMANNDPLGAAMRAVPAALQTALRPIFDVYIPRLKVGTWAREYAFELERRAPELEKGTITRGQLARQTWSFVEDRFGELNWDNLYWNRTFKSALQLAFRSVTWKLGNIRAFGKAIKDTGYELGYNWYKDTAGGEMVRALPKGPRAVLEQFRNAPAGATTRPRVTLPMAWAVGMVGITTVQASILSKIFTGKYPWQLSTSPMDLVKNLTYPRISKEDSSQRVNIPTYWKDAVHLIKSPYDYVKSSMTGEFGRLIETWTNKDFYGREVAHPDDPVMKQAYDRFIHMIPVPFSWSSVSAAYQSGATRTQSALGMMGYTKAPYYVSHSRAEQMADELIRADLPMGSRTKEQYDKTIREKQAIQAVKRGDMTMDQAVDRGLVQQNRVKEAMAQSDESVLMYHFARLKPADQLKVYKLAGTSERQQQDYRGQSMHDMIEEKIARSRTLSQDEKDQLSQQLEELGK